MKKKLLVGLVTVGLIFGATACGNMQLVDTTWTFDEAIISLPNGEVVSGKVQSWTDFEEGDQIQLKIDGKQYLTHISNVVLISK